MRTKHPQVCVATPTNRAAAGRTACFMYALHEGRAPPPPQYIPPHRIVPCPTVLHCIALYRFSPRCTAPHRVVPERKRQVVLPAVSRRGTKITPPHRRSIIDHLVPAHHGCLQRFAIAGQRNVTKRCCPCPSWQKKQCGSPPHPWSHHSSENICGHSLPSSMTDDDRFCSREI